MTDVRENIIARVATLMGNLGIAAKVERDYETADDDTLPVIIVNSGEDESEEPPQAREPSDPLVCVATVEVIYVHGDKRDLVGPALSAARAKIIYAITHDATLAAMTVKSRGVRYLTTGNTTFRGREVFGEMGIAFAFRYVLWPDRLT
jgi:hypothetical protein